MAPSPYTTTYTVFGKTYRYTHDYDYPTDTSTYRFGGYNPFDDDVVRAAVAGYAIALGELLDRLLSRVFEFSPLTCWSCISGVIFGLQVIALIVVAIVYFKRQQRRKVSTWIPASTVQAINE